MDILKYIPGFRSNTTWKKVIAIIYYIFCLLMLGIGFDAFLFFAAAPFVVFSFIDLIQHNKKGISLKKATIPLVISLAIALIGLSMSSTAEDTKGSEPSSHIAQKDQTQVSEQLTNTDIQTKEDTESAEQKDTVADDTNTSVEPENLQTDIEQNNVEQDNTSQEFQDKDSQQQDVSQTPVIKKLKVHFLNVGQADSILIQVPNEKNILIDAGNNADSDFVVNYLKSQGVKKLNYVVGTHPHEDHIGGLDVVINTFEIDKVIMPKVSHTTKTFEDVLTAISNKSLKITSPTPGSTFSLGETRFTILAPNSSTYDELNNYSIVLKMEYGDTSFLFTGDAEDISENEMISKGYNLSADVLKIGHHGSNSSTTQNFLNKVNPKYAVIMVGTDNTYGHPHQETMDKLKSKNIQVYRTDENGTIVATSDGNNITFNTQPGSYTSRGNGNTSSSVGNSYSNSSSKTITNSSEKSTESSTKNDSNRIVYWTPNGKSYHYTKDCPTLSRSKTILDGPLSECPKDDPCDKCVR